jgi:hypothetical protein
MQSLGVYLAVASSITSTFERFKMARAIHNSCFSPVEKFSPPSDTGESRFRKMLAFTVSSSKEALSSSDGNRCTRRSASNYMNVSKDFTGSVS